MSYEYSERYAADKCLQEAELEAAQVGGYAKLLLLLVRAIVHTLRDRG